MIIILDCGSQVTKLIARRIRELNVYSIILPHFTDIAKIISYNASGIIISGSPSSVHDDNPPTIAKEVWQHYLLILTICYGMQYMLANNGGMVEKSLKREFGKANITISSNDSKLTTDLAQQQQVWMSHSDHVAEVGENFNVIATTTNGVIAVVEHKQKPWYGVQFHPEVVHTPKGSKLLKNFVLNICHTANNWAMNKYLHTAITNINQQVQKNQHVICGLSGGVDSSVTAILLHKAIKNRLTCVFVDTGLLRLGEREQVENLFRQHYDINLEVVDASNEFLSALKGVTDPEKT